MKTIEVNIGSLIAEGVDIRNVHQLQVEIEQALTRLINDHGNSAAVKTNNVENSSAGPLNYTNKLNTPAIAERIAQSVYPQLGNTITGNSGFNNKTGKNNQL